MSNDDEWDKLKLTIIDMLQKNQQSGEVKELILKDSGNIPNVADCVVTAIKNKLPKVEDPEMVLYKCVSIANGTGWDMWVFYRNKIVKDLQETPNPNLINPTDQNTIEMVADCTITKLKALYPNADSISDIPGEVGPYKLLNCIYIANKSARDIWTQLKSSIIELLKIQPNPDSGLNLKDVKNIEMTANCCVSRLKARYPDLDNPDNIPEDVGKQTLYDCVSDANNNQIHKNGKTKMSIWLIIGLVIGGLILLLLILYMLMHRVKRVRE
jgi:hypothetical protein